MELRARGFTKVLPWTRGVALEQFSPVGRDAWAGLPRPISLYVGRVAVEKNIEDPLAEHLLRGDIREGDVVKVSHDEETKRLKFAADKRETTDIPAETPAP